MDTPSGCFFSDLPVRRVSLSRLLADEAHFVAVPRDWHVVVTDIEDSTAAVLAGRHELVNLVATGSIIATLNLAHGAGLLVPFFFGGDGATLLVPPSLLAPVLGALAAHQANTRASFGLELRVGSVPVAELYASGHTLAISRLRLSEPFSIPVVLGHGLGEAERIIKGHVGPEALEPADRLDLQGMECRWDRIEPAVRSNEVVSLLVATPDGHGQAPVFKRVVDLLDDVYGSPDSRNPISLSRLKLNTGLGKLAAETRARLGRFSVLDLVRTWTATQLGRLFFLRSPEGRHYLRQLVALSDTLVIDGRINTVITGTPEQRERLEAGLTEMERDGLITYGLSVSGESVLSCYVSDRADKHVHFVDGADGGYTKAAGVLKRKLRGEAGPA